VFCHPSSHCRRAGVGNDETHLAQTSRTPSLPHHPQSFGCRRHWISQAVMRHNETRCSQKAMITKHYPMEFPDPVEAIKYHMDQNGLQPRDLIPFIGSRNGVHEVLNRRRSLTLKMIWRLHEGLGIPAESLIKVGQEHAA
jgi:antitoxin component HigA of HigAB toxin-antitoxin module